MNKNEAIKVPYKLLNMCFGLDAYLKVKHSQLKAPSTLQLLTIPTWKQEKYSYEFHYGSN